MEGYNNVKRTLYTDKGVLIESFMYDPVIELTSECGGKRSFLINVNPIIIIRSTQKKNGLINLLKNNYFKVNPKNHFKVVKFFNNILKWFFDKNMNDLFYEYEGELIFNADYKSLNEKLKVGTKSIQRMNAIPSVVEYGGRKQEGVVIYINENKNQLILTLNQIQDIFGILSNFSFQHEIIILYEALKDISNNKFIKRENIWGKPDTVNKKIVSNELLPKENDNKGGKIEWK